jgi:lysyl-tRNA synthetase class 2
LPDPFARMTVLEAILSYNPDLDAAALGIASQRGEVVCGAGHRGATSWGLGKMQIEIFEKTAEHRLAQPTFITAYPTEVSPLARRNDEIPL